MLTRADLRSVSDELEVLQNLCHAFGSAAHHDEAANSTVRWAQEALGGEASAIKLITLDSRGRLFNETPADDSASPHAAEREQAFRSRKPVYVPLERLPGHCRAFLPLVTRGESVGVLEVMAPESVLVSRGGTLAAVVAQAAIMIKRMNDRARQSDELETLSEMSLLVRDLLRANEPLAALSAAMDVCHIRFQSPVAAWKTKDDPRQLELAGTRGMDASTKEALAGGMRTIASWDTLPNTEREAVISLFCQINSVEKAHVVDAGSALLLVGGSSSELLPSIAVVGSLLEHVLRNLNTVAAAEQRHAHLDMGLAWTAHEMRGPLLASKFAIERFLEAGGNDRQALELLRQSGLELEDAANTIEGLLRWSTGDQGLGRERVDLVELVGGAVESCGLYGTSHEIVIKAPARLDVEADGTHLRTALTNVLRNAIAYSPDGGRISVLVEKRSRLAVVEISDEGPGIHEDDREAIFDPLVRGKAASRSRGGKGLGLFIARRVLEAHDGRIWAVPGESGATFKLELPVAGAGSVRP